MAYGTFMQETINFGQLYQLPFSASDRKLVQFSIWNQSFDKSNTSPEEHTDRNVEL